MSLNRSASKQFEYGEVYLSTPNADTDIDLTPSWVQLEVTEGIYSPFISGNITILDSGGFQEIIPLIGEETLFINLSTGNFRDNTSRSQEPTQNKEIKGRYRIYKISEPVKTNNAQSKMYTLFFVSETYFRNKKSRVQRSYQNRKISEIVKNIYEEFIKEESIVPSPLDAYEKDVNVESTLNFHTFCIPNMSPYEAINMIKRKAISAPAQPTPLNPNPNLNQGATFLFFETMDTFEFVSLEQLMNAQSVQTLLYKPKSTQKTGRGDTLEMNMNSVEDYNVVKTFDVLENMEEGMYSSRLITYDITKQQFSEVEYNYLPKKLEKQVKAVNNRQRGLTSIVPSNINTNEERADGEVEDLASHIAPGKLCSEHMDLLYNPKQKVYLKPTRFNHNIDFQRNTKFAGGPIEKGILPDQIELSFLQRKSQLQQLQNIKIGVLVRGNSERHPGQMVEFKLPSDRVNENNNPASAEEHLFYSGRFLITSARHVFVNRSGESGTYTTHLELSKDSLNTKLPGVNLVELDPNNLQSAEEERAIENQKALLNLTTTGKIVKGVS